MTNHPHRAITDAIHLYSTALYCERNNFGYLTSHALITGECRRFITYYELGFIIIQYHNQNLHMNCSSGRGRTTGGEAARGPGAGRSWQGKRRRRSWTAAGQRGRCRRACWLSWTCCRPTKRSCTVSPVRRQPSSCDEGSQFRLLT